MMNALFTAATGMEAQQLRIAVISNNLANMNTSGFKQSKAVFEDLIYQTYVEPGVEQAGGNLTPSGLQVGTGVKVVATPSVFTQGTMEQTARELDVAIEGSGFFAVDVNGTSMYTRSGALAVNDAGNLVTQSGFPIQPAPGNLLGVTNITISSNGVISGIAPGATEVSTIGTLQVTTFANPSGLKAVGRNLFQETPASGTPTASNAGENGAGTVRQGFLETSNVNVAEELIRMVLAQRSFELNSKVVRTADDMMGAVNNIR